MGFIDQPCRYFLIKKNVFFVDSNNNQVIRMVNDKYIMIYPHLDKYTYIYRYIMIMMMMMMMVTMTMSMTRMMMMMMMIMMMMMMNNHDKSI